MRTHSTHHTSTDINLETILSEAGQIFTGREPTRSQKDGYCKALSKYPARTVKEAMEYLYESHIYRNIPLPADIINIIKTKINSKRSNFVTDIPQFMVYNRLPKSSQEMQNHLNTADKESVYYAIIEWNRLSPEEREERFDHIGMSYEKRIANLKRIKHLLRPAYDHFERLHNEVVKKVKCCVCSEETTPITSVNHYVKYYKPESKQGVDQYACDVCMKVMLKTMEKGG